MQRNWGITCDFFCAGPSPAAVLVLVLQTRMTKPAASSIGNDLVFQQSELDAHVVPDYQPSQVACRSKRVTFLTSARSAVWELGTQIMTRAADEEKLHVLKVWRQSEPEAATPPPSKLPKPDMQVLGFDRSLYQRVYEPAEVRHDLVK